MNQLASMNDPKGLVGRISACETSAQRLVALSKLDMAVSRADKARAAEYAGNIKEAFEWWDLLFNGEFPAYG
jgi:hypothetical protein